MPLQRVNPEADLVEAVEQPIDPVRGQLRPPRADRAKQILGDVYQPCQRRHVEQAGRAFQRMDAAKQLVDRRLVGRRLLEPEQRRRGSLQQVTRLLHKTREQRVHGAAPPVSRRTVPARSAGLTGLTRYKFAPAW